MEILVFAVGNFWYENYLMHVAKRLILVNVCYHLAFFKVHVILVKSQLSVVFPGTDVIVKIILSINELKTISSTS